MSDISPSQILSSLAVENPSPLDSLAGQAAVSEATRPVSVIHISLAGMSAIVLVLIGALGLPVFGLTPVYHPLPFLIIIATTLGGMAYLYYLNYRIHLLVRNQARLTEVLVNSLGQGFLSFNQAGICGAVYSHACLELLETVPANAPIEDVLQIPEAGRSDFRDWMDILFMPGHALGFDDVTKFLPQFFPHSHGRKIHLAYKPIHDKNHMLSNVVVIATDQTEEFEAQVRAEQQQSYAEMICRIFKERNQFMATITHIRKFLEAANTQATREDTAALLRLLHTLKAAVKYFHLEELGRVIHEHETHLRSEAIDSDEEFQRRLQIARKDVEVGLLAVLDQVRDLIGQDYEGNGTMHEVQEEALFEFAEAMEKRHADPALIRLFLNTIAAIPANQCFRQFDRELIDLAEITGKQLKPVRYTGTNPRVVVQPIQEFLFSLTHIGRNIIDHGIEPAVTRLARGKDPAGQVSIHTDVVKDSDHKEWLHIIISDDGNGIDPARIRTKLAAVNPQGDWRQEDDQAIIQHIFSWGFSTRENVTDLSGQGVGMEAVEREVKLLGGDIKVESELYHGTKLSIRVPYILDLHRKPDHLPIAASL
jgi:two-component system chemotaxis sensor kinase CheA